MAISAHSIADREVGFKWRYYSPALVVDGGGNKFTARVKSTGGEAWLQIFKRMPGGVRVLVREIQSELGKSDHAAIVQSGADLHWTLTAHEGDTACNEQEGVLTGRVRALPRQSPVRHGGRVGARWRYYGGP
jgi:hypothetical protein